MVYFSPTVNQIFFNFFSVSLHSFYGCWYGLEWKSRQRFISISVIVSRRGRYSKTNYLWIKNGRPKWNTIYPHFNYRSKAGPLSSKLDLAHFEDFADFAHFAHFAGFEFFYEYPTWKFAKCHPLQNIYGDIGDMSCHFRIMVGLSRTMLSKIAPFTK